MFLTITRKIFLFRLNFLAVDRKYYVIELKVSVGEVGEIYEDGSLKVSNWLIYYLS